LRKEAVYRLDSLYQDDLTVYGYHFGKGDRAVCIVGSTAGYQVQQMYIGSQLIRALKELEERGAFVSGNEVLVIPCVDPFSMNRLYADPGRLHGESVFEYQDGREEWVQGLKAQVLQTLRGYHFGIRFTGFGMQGDFISHVRMVENQFQKPGLANLFGLPFVALGSPKEIEGSGVYEDWRQWETGAFSICTNRETQIDEASARKTTAAVLRFLARMGILRYTSHSGFVSMTVWEEDLKNVKCDAAGIYRPFVSPGQEVCKGDRLAEVLDPYEGEAVSRILSPAQGIVFFAYQGPLVTEETLVFKIIKRLHQ